jgi:hypothetical protein
MKTESAQIATSDDTFELRFRGHFTGILTWDQLTAFWAVVRDRADAGWYIYAVGETVPAAPASAAEVTRFVDEIDRLLRADHDEDYCGIVYADDKATPTFIKIFDPHNLGVSCGSSKNPPLPGWILCQITPTALHSNRIVPGNRQRWWQKLWA